MKRFAIVITSAAMTVGGFTLPTTWAAEPNNSASPAQTDNQLNHARPNTNDATNNANAAVNNGAAAADNAANNAANTANNTAESTGDKVRSGAEHMTAGNPSADNPAPDAKDIRKALGNVTEAALTKNNLGNLTGYFVDADRNRIKNSDTYSEDFGKQLDGRIEQINQAWKAKYGHEFKVKSSEDAFSNFAMIRQGEIGRDAQLASEVIRNSQDANLSNHDNAAGNSKGDENLEPGRQVAIVTIRDTEHTGQMHDAGHEGNMTPQARDTAENTAEKAQDAAHVAMGGRGLRVPMIHEMPDSWKINAPDTLTAAKLRQNLLDHLTAIGDKSDQWPADENTAARLVTRQVLMAVLDKPMHGSDAGASMNEGTSPQPAMPGAAK